MFDFYPFCTYKSVTTKAIRNLVNAIYKYITSPWLHEKNLFKKFPRKTDDQLEWIPYSLLQ